MSLVSVPIDLATDAQVRLFGETLGVEFEPTDRRGEMLSKLAMVFTGDSIRVPEDVVRSQQGAAPRAPEGSGDDPFSEALGIDQTAMTGYRDDPKVTVIIEDRENDGEILASGGGISKARDVGIGVNGVVIQVRRGVAATIPYRFYLALLNAKRQSYSMDPNTGEMTSSEVAMYSMQPIAIPSPEEIRAWRERTGDVVLA